MALVIKKWYASTSPNQDGNYVHLIGREAGLFAWLLSVIGLDPTTEVKITDNLITFGAASLSGRNHYCPVKRASARRFASIGAT